MRPPAGNSSQRSKERNRSMRSSQGPVRAGRPNRARAFAVVATSIATLIAVPSSTSATAHDTALPGPSNSVPNDTIETNSPGYHHMHLARPDRRRPTSPADVADIPAGDNPTGIVIDDRTGSVYVANGSGVAVI